MISRLKPIHKGALAAFALLFFASLSTLVAISNPHIESYSEFKHASARTLLSTSATSPTFIDAGSCSSNWNNDDYEHDIWDIQDWSVFETNRCVNRRTNLHIQDKALHLDSVLEKTGKNPCSSSQMVSEDMQSGTVCARIKTDLSPGYYAVFERALPTPNNLHIEQRFGVGFTSTSMNFYEYFREASGAVKSSNMTVRVAYDPSKSFHRYCIQLEKGEAASFWIDNKFVATSLQLPQGTIANTTSFLTNFLVYSPSWLAYPAANSRSTLIIDDIEYAGNCPKKNMSVGKIVGICIGCVAGLILIAIALERFYKSYMQPATTDSSPSTVSKDGSSTPKTTGKPISPYIGAAGGAHVVTMNGDDVMSESRYYNQSTRSFMTNQNPYPISDSSASDLSDYYNSPKHNNPNHIVQSPNSMVDDDNDRAERGVRFSPNVHFDKDYASPNNDSSDLTSSPNTTDSSYEYQGGESKGSGDQTSSVEASPSNNSSEEEERRVQNTTHDQHRYQ